MRRSAPVRLVVSAFLLAGLESTADAQVFETALAGTHEFEDFGPSVALSGDTLAVGEPSEGVTANTSGAVNVFVHGGGGWTLQAELRASNPTLFTYLGDAVSLDGDVLVAGGWGKSDGSWSQPGYERGAAWIFRRNGAHWSQEAFLQPPTVLAYDHFGRSVAIDGDVVAVGAPYADQLGQRSGGAFVFRRVGGVWTLEATLVAPDGAARHRFGAALALSGATLAVGAPEADGAVPDAGAVYVFVHDGLAWTLQQKVVAAGGARADRFGRALDLDGDTLAVGVPWRDPLGAGNAGALAVFARSGGAWLSQGWLSLPAPVAVDNLGSAVALDGNLMIAGAPDDDDAAALGGGAHLWRRIGGAWSLEASLFSPLTTPDDGCGFSVALDGGRAAVGNLYREGAPLGAHGAVDVWTGLEDE